MPPPSTLGLKAEATGRTRAPHVTRAKRTHGIMKNSIIAAVMITALTVGGVFLFAQSTQTPERNRRTKQGQQVGRGLDQR